jgi:hypothetical protein
MIMAIYQFFLAAAPKEAVREFHRKIPEQIGDHRMDSFDLKTENYWNIDSTQTVLEEIIAEIDTIVKRADWGKDKFSTYWKTYTDSVDNDARLYLNKDTGKIHELSFRADLREQNLQFLMDVLALARRFNWLLINIKGQVAEPEPFQIKELIKVSKPYIFLENPKKYFDDLSSGKKTV